MRRSRSFGVAGVGAFLASVLAVALVVTPVPASAATKTPFAIATSPPLVPQFSPSIPDYAISCSASPTTQVDTSGSGRVQVGGKSFAGPVDLAVPLAPNQGLEISNGSRHYFVRCLPSDFPSYSSAITGTPQITGVLVTPTLFNPVGNYIVVFDAHGVPVWWYRDTTPITSLPPIDAKFFGPLTIGWGIAGNYVLHRLNGIVEKVVGGDGVVLDPHDLERLPNGNYLGITDVLHCCVDLSSWGRSSKSTIVDDVIVELNSHNQIVWSWSTADHVDVAAENVNWRAGFPDVIHMNSIQYDGNGGIIFSARHLDAVYRIDMSTGAIMWKLGGTPTSESLNVVGDQYAAGNPDALFSGQHFARILPDGTLTVQDNGSLQARPVRALRFTIDTTARTATEIEHVTDSRLPGPSFCCGSAVKLPTGDWLMSWGANNIVTELTPQGAPQLTITFASFSSYRAATIDTSITALRRGMDAMVHPVKL